MDVGHSWGFFQRVGILYVCCLEITRQRTTGAHLHVMLSIGRHFGGRKETGDDDITLVLIAFKIRREIGILHDYYLALNELDNYSSFKNILQKSLKCNPTTIRSVRRL